MRGKAGHGRARRGVAGQGTAGQGTARRGTFREGKVRLRPRKGTSKIKKIRAASNGYALKTKRTSSKKEQLKSGLSVREDLAILNTNISIAMGILATLSLGHASDWMHKYKRTDPEHLRILLQEVMDEIWNAQEALDRLTSHRLV